LILFDKGLTIANMIQVQKNFPEAVKDDPYKAEKNPIAKWFFNKFGLLVGTFFYAILSLATMFIAYFLLSKAFHPSVALYIVVIAFGFIIANNFYFLFKYSRLIP
ncbi:unnamed protein product, partial [marine sediment metagenome]